MPHFHPPLCLSLLQVWLESKVGTSPYCTYLHPETLSPLLTWCNFQTEMTSVYLWVHMFDDPTTRLKSSGGGEGQSVFSFTTDTGSQNKRQRWRERAKKECGRPSSVPPFTIWDCHGQGGMVGSTFSTEDPYQSSQGTGLGGSLIFR